MFFSEFYSTHGLKFKSPSAALLLKQFFHSQSIGTKRFSNGRKFRSTNKSERLCRYVFVYVCACLHVWVSMPVCVCVFVSTGVNCWWLRKRDNIKYFLNSVPSHQVNLHTLLTQGFPVFSTVATCSPVRLSVDSEKLKSQTHECLCFWLYHS